MRFCKTCFMPDTRPDLEYDATGICDACVMAQRKMGKHANSIDWDKRQKDLKDLIERYRSDNPAKWDCIIGVSGGKDSTYQVYLAKEVYGLRPLCVCFEPTLPTEVGRRNLDNINRMGVDLIHVKRNPIVYDKLIIEGFKRVGDMEWANHAAIWSLPYRFAIAFDIPLILWGEGRMEYSGNFFTDEKHLREMDEEWFTDFGVLNGLRPEDLVGEETGLTLSDMKLYMFPSKGELARVGGNKGCVGIFLGYYYNWDVRKIVAKAEEYGFERRPDRVEGTWGDSEKLDCLSMNLHDYLKYCKFGYGRATDDATRDVRHGHMTREAGLRLIERYDGQYPKEAIDIFCAHFNMSRQEFDSICDGFTNPAIFETRNGKFLRDADGGLVMKREIIEARRNS